LRRSRHRGATCKGHHRQANGTAPPLLSNVPSLVISISIPLPLIWKGLKSPRKDTQWYFFFNHNEKVLSDHLKGQNDYLEQFLQHEKSYLNHLIDQEIPPTNLTCGACGKEEGQYRCLDCYGENWWCRPCLTKSHSHHPFHRPQQWKDGSFEKVSLCDLGYVLVLGCSSSPSCCSEDGGLFGDRRMDLVHVNGVFEHCVRFCKCPDASSEHEQLFVHRLFPSTFDRPKTAFTLDVLDYFGIDAMECKTSAQSFFQKLRRVTNNAFPDEVPVSSLLAAIHSTVS